MVGVKKGTPRPDISTVEKFKQALLAGDIASYEGARLLRSSPPDLMYLSTSDYVQHKHAPGDAAANRFYGAIDGSLAEIDRLGAALVVTADHGMRAKADADGRVRAVFLQDVLDVWLGAGGARVVLCCRSGLRAWRAARVLRSQGHEKLALIALGD